MQNKVEIVFNELDSNKATGEVIFQLWPDPLLFYLKTGAQPDDGATDEGTNITPFA